MKATIKSLKVKRDYNRKYEPYRWANKMYIWPEGESVWENLANRRTRPHTYYKKEIVPMVLEAIKVQYPEFYNEVKDAKWGWRQKCGCGMCPCSPGFVADTQHNLDISVTVLFEE